MLSSPIGALIRNLSQTYLSLQFETAQSTNRPFGVFQQPEQQKVHRKKTAIASTTVLELANHASMGHMVAAW